MAGFGEEVDYLAGTQLDVDPASFQQRVKEAFLLEHDCVENKDIAEVLGVDRSRVTQLFKAPGALKAETIRSLLSHVRSERYRQRIVQAWIQEALGVDVSRRRAQPSSIGTVTDRVLRRVDRQMRESRLLDAARTALEAAGKAEDRVLREQFLDRAYFARLRLNLPGQAMAVAHQIGAYARQDGDFARLAAAHYFRARLLTGLPEARLAPIADLLTHVATLLETPHEPALPYFVPTPPMVEVLRMSSYILFVERGSISASAEDLRAVLARISGSFNPKGSYQQRFNRHLLAARVLLLLGEHFRAQEEVEAAYKAGKLKNLNGLEMCGILEARILRHTEPASDVVERLQRVSTNCAAAMDFQHRLLAEQEVARILSAEMAEQS